MPSSSSSAGRLVPTAMLLPPFARTPTTAVVELPVPIAAGCQRQKEIGCSSDDMQTPGSRVKYHSALPVYIETQTPCGSMPPQHGLIVRSPSSPSSFVTQSEVAEVRDSHTSRPSSRSVYRRRHSLCSVQQGCLTSYPVAAMMVCAVWLDATHRNRRASGSVNC